MRITILKEDKLLPIQTEVVPAGEPIVTLTEDEYIEMKEYKEKYFQALETIQDLREVQMDLMRIINATVVRATGKTLLEVISDGKVH
jgi:hypothetical protein